LPGILSWAVEGCIKWQRDGLREPAAVSQHTASYRNEMDVLGAFLEECCVAGPSESVSAAQLYSTFRDWAQESGEYLMSQTMFGRRLNDRGFRREKSRDDNNRVWWHGVGLSQAGAGRQFETV
jgi:putative DNA primase/helicase